MSPDRRIRRTQQALTGALVELMLEKGFDTLTVAEIADRADVGRSTFYAHYADKEDLLQGSLSELRDGLRAAIEDEAGAKASHPALRFCRPMAEHVGDNRRLHALFAGGRGSGMVQELMREMWADFIREGWPGADPLAVHAVAGAFEATVTWWLGTAPELSAEQVVLRFEALMTPALSR